jgi:hypothetical protein
MRCFPESSWSNLIALTTINVRGGRKSWRTKNVFSLVFISPKNKELFAAFVLCVGAPGCSCLLMVGGCKFLIVCSFIVRATLNVLNCVFVFWNWERGRRFSGLFRACFLCVVCEVFWYKNDVFRYHRSMF